MPISFSHRQTAPQKPTLLYFAPHLHIVRFLHGFEILPALKEGFLRWDIQHNRTVYGLYDCQYSNNYCKNIQKTYMGCAIRTFMRQFRTSPDCLNRSRAPDLLCHPPPPTSILKLSDLPLMYTRLIVFAGASELLRQIFHQLD